MKIIAHVYNDFPTKFALPRQSGLVPELMSRIVFTPEFRDREAIRGIDGFSHLWIIWELSEAKRDSWSPTVRPPKLGGNTRMGVFATRSPFRPNPIGLSSVRLVSVEETDEGCVLIVSGGDMMDGTPVYDIKPYNPYSDCHPDAEGGFAAAHSGERIKVEIGEELISLLPEEKREPLIGVLSLDPRPAYHDDPERIYGFPYGGFEIKFKVSGDTLYVTDIVREYYSRGRFPSPIKLSRPA
ncbi:MAG: tRNA (N6-threonylcarbamoyladenosine(37)-N6)-methyltransferase TrmO, partial [Oscillospiraceae bacterium]|nr:tRNA (N6-threonylcarbamoyladenosine(37)-N6)-methyltransferase TrmO [Oscillospiraceae bacterium]